MIFEYDGFKHYISIKHITSDEIKMDELVTLKLRRIRIPYYYQLTKDMAKFIFRDLMFHFTGQKYYSDEKYYESIKKIYKDPKTGAIFEKFSIDKLKKKIENEYPIVIAPGLSRSEYVPNTLQQRGLKQISDDFEFVSDRDKSIKFPESAKHQFYRSLELYVRDCDLGKGGRKGEKYVLPIYESKEAKRFMEGYNNYLKNRKEEYFKEVFFHREPYELI